MSARLSSLVSSSLTYSLCWRALYFLLPSLHIQQKMSVVLEDKCACTPLSSGNQLDASFTLLCRSSFFKEHQLYNYLYSAFPSKDTVKFLANRMIRSFLHVQINSIDFTIKLDLPSALLLYDSTFWFMSLIRKVTQKIKWPEQQRALPARLWLKCTHLLSVKHW